MQYVHFSNFCVHINVALRLSMRGARRICEPVNTTASHSLPLLRAKREEGANERWLYSQAREFETVMQTLDYVLRLHNLNWEFSQPPE